ncbi:MAG: RNA recognition motif domain-containing protein [Dehalococcoidia bacterium]
MAMKKIYVGNLAWGVSDDELRRAFEPFGAVASARITTDRETGRSRGFGFVEMEDADANQAIASLHGAILNGRALTVNEAMPRDPSAPGTSFAPRPAPSGGWSDRGPAAGSRGGSGDRGGYSDRGRGRGDRY